MPTSLVEHHLGGAVTPPPPGLVPAPSAFPARFFAAETRMPNRLANVARSTNPFI